MNQIEPNYMAGAEAVGRAADELAAKVDWDSFQSAEPIKTLSRYLADGATISFMPVPDSLVNESIEPLKPVTQ